MDDERFDFMLRSLFGLPSRRGALRLLTGSALGGLLAFGQATKAKKKRSKCKCKNKDGSGGGQATPSCPEPPCAPNCTGKTCGPDGCGGSCGSCTGGTCRNGTCDCSGSGKEVCGGNCVDPCDPTERRNPFTCSCCIANDQPSAALCSPSFPNNCCSGNCDPNGGGGNNCLGSRGTCQFNAQCASLNCQANGTCAI